MPVNVAEFYVQATRMVGAIATLRGYDVRDPHVRTAVLLTLVGAKADEVLAKAGLTTGRWRDHQARPGQAAAGRADGGQQGVAFRLMRGVFERIFSRFGRGVPFVGGIVGAVIDGWMMRRHRRAGAGGVPARVCIDDGPGGGQQ